MPPKERDPQLSAIARANTINAIATDGTPTHLPGRAVALREALRGNRNSVLTGTENAMLAEWLDRLADQQGS
ncbi:hypothetical protein [Mycobacterium sherrisii]|uniref:Uncharacterized protein n=1 Tax=Mycobacterium sherrisii TaxID=243061 RepID=A0A1E3SRC5_9MYCO|nr:hypothetical protein [Mycobacterium sherrisii]MCV7028432.1 hypothetical protein [Mycobacterium sherrisii]MEC4764096.1 hypothetical protein [Mycobacterium sherrisii]ODR04669.1 hypothetical protein BHQ21_16780 [Mycobacterium sherrisii]ORW76209.1 hypothetical protein AWC25_11990 [Mycobacterium sherrisii]